MDLDLLAYFLFAAAWLAINLMCSWEQLRATYGLTPPHRRAAFVLGAAAGQLVIGLLWPIVFGLCIVLAISRWWR